MSRLVQTEHPRRQPLALTPEPRTSSALTRDTSCDLILRTIRAHQSLSRSDIALQSGLQKSTVSQIVEQLIGEGWIVEGAIPKTARGRRPTMLSFNDNLAVMAVDLRSTQATVAVVDLNSRILAMRTVPLASEPEVAAREIADAIRCLQTRFVHKVFQGLGVSMSGRVNPETQTVEFAPDLRWIGFDLKATLGVELGLQVELDHAANAILVSEAWLGSLNGVRDAIVLTISEEIGAGILAHGLLITGKQGLAGEFGHISIDASGPLCACGERGCWNLYGSNTAALKKYAELSAGAEPESYLALLKRVASGDAHALAAIESQAEALGRGLRLLTASLAPELIVISGEIASLWSRLGKSIEQKLCAGTLAGRAPRLLADADADLARLRGAAALVIWRSSGHYHSLQTPANPEERLKMRKRSGRNAFISSRSREGAKQL